VNVDCESTFAYLGEPTGIADVPEDLPVDRRTTDRSPATERLDLRR
jgi:hypothetical protein